ncbi:MAG: DUF11 domain-containing protein [Planctomycetaceae bacterium]|jgi:uncharacterized repeat protein (TIGR01451 family)|nr:DUF11 domain-containing protein [Planctomycetaceae bacterium]
MARSSGRLIIVRFVSGMFLLLFGFFLSESHLLTYAQQPLPLPNQAAAAAFQNHSAINSSDKISVKTSDDYSESSQDIRNQNSSVAPNKKVSSQARNNSRAVNSRIVNASQPSQHTSNVLTDYRSASPSDANLLGQKEAKKPGLFERIRRTILGDDDDEDEKDGVDKIDNEREQRPRQIAPAQPLTPPKPTTVPASIRNGDSPTNPSTLRDIGNAPATEPSRRTPQPERNTNSSIRVIGDIDSGVENAADRLSKLRNGYFAQHNFISEKPIQGTYGNYNPNNPIEFDEPFDVAPRVTRSENFINGNGSGNVPRHDHHQTPRSTFPMEPQPYDDPYQTTVQPSTPSTLRYNATSMHSSDSTDGIATTGRGTGTSPWNTTANQSPELINTYPSAENQPNTTNRQQPAQPQHKQPAQINPTVTLEKRLTKSPLIEVEAEGDSKVIVGRESKYSVRVSNRGGATAEKVILTIEIPNWIKLPPPGVSVGAISLQEEIAKKDARDLVWLIGKLEPNQSALIELSLVPQERKAIDLKIHYDFFRQPTTATIAVEEPVIEMDIQGPNEILWGKDASYVLTVRNVGGGDAEKVKLELLGTGSALKEYTFPLIRAGEEKAIAVDVYAGKQQKSIDINIQATGSYNVSAKASKRVTILRPEVTMTVTTAETQFVGTPAEFTITLKNSGNADAKNLDLTTTIPIGAKYISSTNSGEITPQNQVRWNIDLLPIDTEFVATVVCNPNREGLCKIDTMLSDKDGSVAKCASIFTAEAMADLRMHVETPLGPIEVGQDAVFVINVTNRGTKAAEKVALLVYCGNGLKPISTIGGTGVSKIENGVVEFEIIPAVSAEQTVVLKVVTRAEQGGMHRIRAELISPYNEDVIAGKVEPQTKLLSEHSLNFYQRKGSSSAVQVQTTSQPRQLIPTNPTPNTNPTPTPQPPITDPFPRN